VEVANKDGWISDQMIHRTDEMELLNRVRTSRQRDLLFELKEQQIGRTNV
jgi:hypothetical protein